MIKNFLVCFLAVSMCFGLASCKMNEGGDSPDILDAGGG